jgi:hypothetical protein
MNRSMFLISPGQFPAPWGGTRVQSLPRGSYHLFITKVFILLNFVLSGCGEVVKFDETCTITGQIVTRDEFGIENNDLANVSVTLDNTGLTATTDETGFFTFSEVPTGTYDIEVTKKSYGIRTIRSIYVYAVSDTLKLKAIDLIQPSSIEIQNFNIEKVGNDLFAKGIIIHKFPFVPTGYGRARVPAIMIYYSMNSDVSYRNYLRNQSYMIEVPSNSEFNINLSWMISYPSSKAETYYYIAYGESILDDRFYDTQMNPESGFTVSYPTIKGKPSNICSLTGE